jgi:DNA repair protein RadA/Sms
MSKVKTRYVCQSCGTVSPKWLGQCSGCQAWNTLEETRDEPVETSPSRFTPLTGSAEIQRLSDVQAQEMPRLPTGVAEFDRVLGGGLVAGAVVLIGGDPGIGKSTLLLQALAHMSQSARVLYVTGEESAQQVALRAKRLELSGSDVDLLPEIRVEVIESHLISRAPAVAVIDSIQTIYSSALS